MHEESPDTKCDIKQQTGHQSGPYGCQVLYIHLRKWQSKCPLVSLHVQSLTPTRTESILSSKVTLTSPIWPPPGVGILSTVERFTTSSHRELLPLPYTKMVWSARGCQQGWSRIYNTLPSDECTVCPDNRLLCCTLYPHPGGARPAGGWQDHADSCTSSWCLRG